MVWTKKFNIFKGYIAFVVLILGYRIIAEHPIGKTLAVAVENTTYN
jgi:hypothetical protein